MPSKAIDLDPKHALAYYNRGHAYSRKGLLDPAIADFKMFVTLSQDPLLIQEAKQKIEEMQK